MEAQFVLHINIFTNYYLMKERESGWLTFSSVEYIVTCQKYLLWYAWVQQHNNDSLHYYCSLHLNITTSSLEPSARVSAVRLQMTHELEFGDTPRFTRVRRWTREQLTSCTMMWLVVFSKVCNENRPHTTRWHKVIKYMQYKISSPLHLQLLFVTSNVCWESTRVSECVCSTCTS